MPPSLGLFLKKLNRRTRSCLEEDRAWQCKASSSLRARHQETQGILVEQQTGPGSRFYPTSPARGWAAGGFWGSHNPRYCHLLGELGQAKAGPGWQPWPGRTVGDQPQCGGAGAGTDSPGGWHSPGLCAGWGKVLVEARGSQVHQCSQLWQAALGGDCRLWARLQHREWHSPAASQQDWVSDIDCHSKARIQIGGARDTWRQGYNVGPRSIKETGLERPETMLPSTQVPSKCRKMNQQDRAAGIRLEMNSVFK